MRNLVLLLLLTCLFLPKALNAQNEEFIQLEGTVKNKKTKEGIPYAHITVANQPIGVNANEEGKFKLILDDVFMEDTIVFSSMGYQNVYFSVTDYLKKNNRTIYLLDTTFQLGEIFITSIPAREIVLRALQRVDVNYSTKPFRLKGFYRNSFKENGNYVRLLESAMNVYDEGFNKLDGISVKHMKMRKSYDYRNFRWKENANYLSSFFYGDFIRNKQGSFRSEFSRWQFDVVGITYFNKDEVFIIKGSIPTDNLKERYVSKLYIRIKDYAMMQLEYDYYWNPDVYPGFDTDTIRFSRTKIGVKTLYREYRNRLYLSYQIRRAKWKVQDLSDPKKGISELEIHDEMLIHKVNARYKRQPEDKINEYGDLYNMVDEYDRKFWKRYNKPVDTQLLAEIKSDLEKEETLEKQFRNSSIQNVMK